jgi:hypothetical protein
MRNDPDNYPLFRYTCLHIPSGQRDDQEYACSDALTRTQMLELINKWNASNPGVWQYFLL